MYKKTLKIRLAPDGGLFLPKMMSQLNFDRLVNLDFTTRMVLMLEDLLPKPYFPIETLEQICSEAYKHFPVTGTPIVQFGENLAVAELFHGPSASFKDHALQLLPHLLRSCQQGDVVPATMVIAATNGDTGGALLSGMQGSDIDGMYGVVLMPANGPSDVQKNQLASCQSDSVKVLQVDGDLDFCQHFVHTFLLEYSDVFTSEYFMLLTSANSISWPRIAVQIAMHSNCYLEAVRTGMTHFTI